MIELSKHIEILLLEHNCVIIPHLGGFIAQDVPARYIVEENLFLPPHRSVGFNPELSINDGLLVQSYMQAYDTNYPDTLKLIDEAVSDLKISLERNGEFELSGIGRLVLNIDGVYEFTPNEAGILSPNLYGLDSVNVKTREEIVPELNSEAETKQCNTRTNSNAKNYTLSINKEFGNYVAAAVVSIFFYFMWATPLTDSTTIPSQQAASIFPRTVQRVQHSQATEPVYIQTDSVNNFSNCEIESCTSKDVKSDKIRKDFTIVLISCIPQKNADNFVEDLRSQGFENVSVYKKNNIIRVVYGHFESEADAYRELINLKNSKDCFEDAWILNKK